MYGSAAYGTQIYGGELALARPLNIGDGVGFVEMRAYDQEYEKTLGSNRDNQRLRNYDQENQKNLQGGQYTPLREGEYPAPMTDGEIKL